ncbi:ligase-associated DNA damage response exonuclease [Olivibacter sp. CPCC 100613]|uniref:ligase-associated DNA damage response exonuclease n=1 Tax=Olivibacter sp. CPCC 100613 TaxID=3079931 RepID=UPI002FF4598C
MLTFNDKGIYCAQAAAYIDPWAPVERAIITHAHADHARFGSKHYLCHRDSVTLLKLRLGPEISIQCLNYGEEIDLNGVKISLHPAGHIIGSAQIRLCYKGQVWVVSGDYKLENDGISTPFEPVKCHHFVSESTFGLPIYRFPDLHDVESDMLSWIDNNKKNNINSLLVGYSLGKAQRMIEIAGKADLPIYAHGAIVNIQQQLIEDGYRLQKVSYASADLKKIPNPYIVVMPPSALHSSWMKKFTPYEVAYCSGWMQLRGARRRRNVNRGFVLSDHADWVQLNLAITATEAENIYVTHGYKSIYAKWLREQYGLNAVEVDTLYEDDLLMQEDKDDSIQ